MEAKNESEVVRSYMRSDRVLTRFVEIMGRQEAERYIASVLLAVAGDARLQECTPQSVLLSAMRAATLGLSVDPVMKQAYLVGFRNNRKGVTEATLIVHYKGYLRLAFNTGLYKTVNVVDVFEGETVNEDRMSGEHTITGTKTGEKVIGRLALFRLFNGFSKDVYMTTDEIREHARKFSPDYSNPKSLWRILKVGDKDNWMEKKTPLRKLFNEWGVFEPAVKKALEAVDEVDSGRLTVDSSPSVLQVAPTYPTGLLGSPSTSQDERPYKPEKLKRVIYARMNKFGNMEATEQERAQLGEIDTDTLFFLTGYYSESDLPDEYVKALAWWLGSAQQSVIQAEAQAVWQEAQKTTVSNSQ